MNHKGLFFFVFSVYTKKQIPLLAMNLKGPSVEASFMMMNQADSRSFDNDKDDDKKPKEWFQD